MRPDLTDALLAMALALAVTFVLTPVVRSLAWRIGAIDEPKPRGLHTVATPRLGGLAILAGVLVAGLVFLPAGQGNRGILVGAAVIVAVGAADDLLDLKAEVKLVGQALAAAVPVAAGVRVEAITLPLLGRVEFGDPLSYVLTGLGIVALVNIVNFIDGVDGLAAGVGTIAAATLGAIALSLGRFEAGVLALLTAGATAGYLRYGLHRASIFLGDSGSNLLGFLLAAIAVQGALKTNAAIALLFPLVVLAVPILDSSFVVAKRIKYGQPVYRADRWHFHHRFANIGFSPLKTTVYLYGWTLSLAALALALRFVPYSDDRGDFYLGPSLVLGAFGLIALGASVYLVVVLEILKLRRFRSLQVGRARAARGDPGSAEADVDAEVAHELETGEFRAVDDPRAEGRNPSAPPDSGRGAL